jgi:hypothetical protein
MVEFLTSVATFIANNLMASSVVVATILEFGLRLFPTEKPKSILLLIKVICELLGKIFGGISAFLDKVIPQQLVP